MLGSCLGSPTRTHRSAPRRKGTKVCVSDACAASSTRTVSNPCVSWRRNTSLALLASVVNTISAWSTNEASRTTRWRRERARSPADDPTLSRVVDRGSASPPSPTPPDTFSFSRACVRRYASLAMSATALFLSSCRRHISRTRLSSSSRSRTSSHGSSASPASRDRRAFSTPASRCALSCALMHAAASRWNASCFRYSRSHSRSPRAIKSSTSVDAHTAATPSATTASDAPTRTTGGRYALAPSSCVNPRTKTRSSRLSTAAFELAQTKMRGLVRPNTRSRPRRTPASRASDAYSSVTVVAALRPEPPPPLSSAWSASNPDAHRAVSSAASSAETSSGKKVLSLLRLSLSLSCSTMCVVQCVCVYRANRTCVGRSGFPRPCLSRAGRALDERERRRGGPQKVGYLRAALGNLSHMLSPAA